MKDEEKMKVGMKGDEGKIICPSTEAPKDEGKSWMKVVSVQSECRKVKV